jgi:hypothetical protein
MDLPAQTTVYLKEYTPAPFLIPEVDLEIDFVGEDDVPSHGPPGAVPRPSGPGLQVASRMTRNFEPYKRFEPKRRRLMRAALEKVAATPGLSKETAEVVGKALA